MPEKRFSHLSSKLSKTKHKKKKSKSNITFRHLILCYSAYVGSRKRPSIVPRRRRPRRTYIRHGDVRDRVCEGQGYVLLGPSFRDRIVRVFLGYGNGLAPAPVRDVWRRLRIAHLEGLIGQHTVPIVKRCNGTVGIGGIVVANKGSPLAESLRFAQDEYLCDPPIGTEEAVEVVLCGVVGDLTNE